MAEEEVKTTMRFRSTGLGKTMLHGDVIDVNVVEDCIVLHIQSVSPVRWHIRAALTYKGLLKVIRLTLKASVIKFLLLGFKRLKNPRLPDEF